MADRGETAPVGTASLSPVTVALIAVIAGSTAAIAFQIAKYIANCVLELKERLFPTPEGGKHARGGKARQVPEPSAGFRWVCVKVGVPSPHGEAL